MTPDAERLSPVGRQLLDRRRFLSQSATSLGSVALSQLLGNDGLLAATSTDPQIHPARPFSPRAPHLNFWAK